MAEEFKILLGVDLKEDSLNSIKNQLNALTDNTHRIRIDIDNSRLLKQIDHAKKELRGLSGTKNNGIPLNVNAKSLEQSFNRVADIIDEIKISFGSLSKGDNMKPLLNSINDISTALSEVSKQFKDLSSSFNGFNLNLSVGGSKNPIAANAAYGQKARTDTIPQLKAQSDYLQNLLGGQEKIISQFLKNMSQFNGVDMFAKIQQMFGDMEDSNLSKQMEAYRQYIDYMKQLAKINNVPLDKFNSNFSKSADELIDATKKIQTGEAETEESMQKLQKIFGGSGIDAEKLTQQLDSIVEKLEGIGKAISDLSSGISIDGLTQSFNDLSDTLERLISNFEHFKNNISANFSNISDANAQAAAEVKQQSDSSASTVVQNEKKKQDAIRQTQKLISDSAQKSIENVSSKRIGRYFEIDKSNSNDFEKEMRGLVNQWTNNKGNLVDLKIDTRTSYDKDAQKNIERLHQAQVTYNNELGETIKKTIAWRKIGTDIGSDGKENLVYGFAEVAGQYSKTLGQTSTQTDRFVKQQKQAVSNLTNQINQLNRAANDQNAARPIKDSDHLNAISSKYNEIISAIQKMADASSATFVDEQNNVKKLISEYKSLVSEYKNAENVSTKMKGTDFESGLKIAENDLKKFKAQAKDYPQITKTINALDEAIKTVGDASSLNKFNDQLRVARSELAKIKAEVSADNRNEKVGINVSGLESKIEDLRKMSPEIDKFETEIDGAKVSVTSLLNELKQVNTQGDFSVVNAKFKAFTDAAKASGIAVAKTVESVAEIKEAIKLGDLDKDSSNIDTKFDKIENKTEELEKSMTEYKAALQAVKDLQDSTDTDAIVNAWNAYNLALEKVNNQLKINKNEQDKVNESQKRARDAKVLESEKNTLLSDADAWLASHTAAAKQFGSEIIELKAKIEACDNAGDLKVLKNSLVDIKNRARIAGKDVMTLGDRLKKQFSQYGSYLSVSSMFSYAEQALRAMYNNVVEIDTAMTNLIKVTDETDATYNRFLLDAGKNAKELGRSFSSFVEQTANWAKMGFNIDESAELAKISSIYANVADVDDATAVSDIVTAMKAFNIEATDSITIIDQLNKLSNEFAVSAAGLGQGLSRAASTMAASGMDMEHTLALLTGIAEITQSPEEAGNFLKVAVARIQGMKGELEELGEEVDESVDSISKVQTQILNLTHGKVNIFDSSGNFRDYYDIMQDIAGIVDELESTERAQLYEILFGKNRMNQGAAMIQAFQSGQIGKALDAAQNSTGSAYAEQEKWMESLEAKLGRLEAAFQSLSQTVLSSDLLGMGIDFITGLVEALDLLIERFGLLGTVIAGIGLFKTGSGLLTLSKDIKSLGDVTTALGTIFPNLAKGIGVFTTALSNGTKGVGLLKAAFSGLWTVIKAHPIIAVITAVAALGIGIYNLSKREEELAEKVEEVTSAYNEQKKTLKDNKNSLDGLISDYEELSKGVDDLGKNVSLTDDEFSRYNEVTDQIAKMFPTLIQGYTDTGNAILTCKGNVEELTKAYNDQIIAANNAILGEGNSVFEDFKTAQRNFEYSDNSNKITYSSAMALDKILHSSDLDAAIDRYAPTGSTMMVEIVKALKDNGFEQFGGNWYNLWMDSESGHDFIKSCIQENRVIAEAIVGDFNAQIEEKTKSMRSLAEAYVENVLLSDDYSDLSTTMYGVVSGITSQMDYEFFSQFDSLQDLYDYLETLLGNFKSLDDDTGEKIEIYLDVKTKFNNNDCTIGEYVQAVNDVNDAISGLDEDTQKSIIISLGLEDADNTLEQYNALIQGLESRGISTDMATEFANSLNASDFSIAVEMTPYLSKEYIETEFEKLQEGGSVDLSLRPTIDASELEKAGWEDAGEGIATVFTSTFANKAADLGQEDGIAINFTPIIVDENGNYIGCLSPDELEEYAMGVIEGTREDDLGLQIGAKFEGRDAIAEAESAAQYIHQLQDFYYTDFSNYGINDLIDVLYEYGRATQLIEPISFSDLIKEEDFSNRVDTYTENVNKLREASEAYVNGEFTNEDFIELVKLFPELAGHADDLDVAIDELLGTMGSDMVAYIYDQFGRLDTEEDCRQAENFANALLNLGETVGNTQFSINIDTEIDSMDSLFKAMDESVSSVGLSTESIEALTERYKGLDISGLFEETANGIHLNARALAELEKEYEDQIKGGYEKELEDLQKEYDRLTEEILNCTDAAELADLYAQQDGIVRQINDVSTLASQYEGLTSAYHKWEKAQSNGSERDMYEGIISGREELEEEMSRGWLDDASIAYLELLSGEDLSTKPIDEQIKAYERLYETIGDTGFNVWDFFTYDDDGNSTSKGVYNFFETVRSEVGETAAWIDENGNYHFDFEAVGGDKVIAEALGISEEAVQILLRAAEDAGFEVNLESPLTEFADLKTSAEEANEALKELGVTEYTFNFNTNELESVNEQIAIAEEMLGKFKNEDGTVNLDIEGAEEAQLALTALVVQKQQLSIPDIMYVDTTQATTDIENAIALLQDYRSEYNNFEINASIGADKTEAETNIQAALTEIQGLSPEIKASLGLDDEAFQTACDNVIANIEAGVTPNQEDLDIINTTISAITPEIMVEAGLDDSLIKKFQDTEHEAYGEVIWGNDTTEVDNYKETTQIAHGEVIWEDNTNGVGSSFTRFGGGGVASTNGGGGRNNVARVNGTTGKAYAKGNWSTKDSGVALGGELGQEVIVRDGRFFTIGDNGAEFFKYERGDIIFNHKQSEELFKYGKVTSNGGRGKALNGGSAFVEGTAFEYGSYGNGPAQITISGSVKKSNSNKGSSNKSSSDTADEFKETFDWIEIAIDRLERAISRLDTKANSTYRSWSSRNKNLKKEISKVGEEIELQQRGYDRYIQQANSVGLSESWAKKVRDGKVDIETITDEELANKIQEYQEWYEKALDCKDAIVELKETQAELYETAFNNIVTQYDGFLSVIEHERNMLEEYISQSEASGYIVSTKYYDALINVEKANIEKLEKEKDALLTSLEEAVNSGTIKPDSEAWYYYNAPLSGNRWRYSI